MGSPAGAKNEQNYWELVDDCRYPNLHEVLPKSLRHLKMDKTDCSTPDCKGIEQALCSALPSSDAGNAILLLNSVEFVYNRMHHKTPLSMNFWRIKHAFQKAGCKFEYKLRLNPEDLMWIHPKCAKGNIERYAEKLADEGPAGIHVALHTGISGLPGQVMEFLGLRNEWLDTEVAKEVLFGEKVDGDVPGR
ncbi:hypothetical protein C7974DRAFT_377383 [Boeremia exigua]|uniref:uncharacterized protein n=1 Tax=Boeremia exigua TaxID=749465 RepID=UPI001E8E53BD|nr:uncharacterized protein C7974DRAFT_377383 [Boeremia exigua]KAH6621701.1 hypothetical protein C7974DRAFT_377383 [Boeremia exigua]